MSATVESGHHEHATTGRAIEEVLIFLSAMNIVLSNIFTSAGGCSVLPDTNCIHCEVAEAEHSLQEPSCHATSYLGLVVVGQNLSSSVLLCFIPCIHETLDIQRFWLGMIYMLLLNPLRMWWGVKCILHVCHSIAVLFPERR